MDWNTTLNALSLVLGALAAGALSAWIARIGSHLSRQMMVTMVVLPPLVCTALLTINGSLGTSIAILGVFGLVRFRSMPGTSIDIVCVFYSMVIGLMFSTGLWLVACSLTLALGMILFAVTRILSPVQNGLEVRISAPESLQDLSVFTRILNDYGKQVKLLKVRTAALGTVYEMTYRFFPADEDSLLKMMEEVREVNGNMNVICTDLLSQESLL